MTLALTAASYFVACVVVYYAIVFCVSLLRTREASDGDPRVFVIFVAAMNEEAVIGKTVDQLLALDHDRFIVCVGNDGSTDATPEILKRYADDPRVVVAHREAPLAQTGKSDVLNDCFDVTTRLLESDHPILGGLDPACVIAGVVDADGRLDRDALRVVEPYFDDAMLASVQIGVRIANADTNLLTRMQDMEFVGFSAFVQRARDRFGSSGLGGNGQFARVSALAGVKAKRGGPWETDALTEDLELGLALVCLGWRTRFCPDVFVAQQGVPTWRALFRQRTRWIQGHYSCWTYLPLLARAPAPLVTRIDLSIYLLLVVTVLFVTFGVAATLLALAGVISPRNEFLSFVPIGRARNSVNVSFGIIPITVFMYVYQRHAVRAFRVWEIPAVALVFTLYSYVWIFATLRALARIAARRRNWVKTPRALDPSPVALRPDGSRPHPLRP